MHRCFLLEQSKASTSSQVELQSSLLWWENKKTKKKQQGITVLQRDFFAVNKSGERRKKQNPKGFRDPVGRTCSWRRGEGRRRRRRRKLSPDSINTHTDRALLAGPLITNLHIILNIKHVAGNGRYGTTRGACMLLSCDGVSSPLKEREREILSHHHGGFEMEERIYTYATSTHGNHHHHLFFHVCNKRSSELMTSISVASMQQVGHISIMFKQKKKEREDDCQY